MIKVKSAQVFFYPLSLLFVWSGHRSHSRVMIPSNHRLCTPRGARGHDAFRMRPWPKCDAQVARRKVLYNLLSVVWPQVSTCGKKEPTSTHCNPRPVPQEVLRCTSLVPHGDFKTLSPLGSFHRLRSRHVIIRMRHTKRRTSLFLALYYAATPIL